MSTSVPAWLLNTVNTNLPTLTTSIILSSVPSGIPTIAGITAQSTPSHSSNAAKTSSTEKSNSTLFNLYFLFLALFGLLVGLLLWWVHITKKQRKERDRVHGQNALARDLVVFESDRGLTAPPRSYAMANRTYREEGLNENGEAPPSYQQAKETVHAQAQEVQPRVRPLARAAPLSGTRPPPPPPPTFRDRHRLLAIFRP